MYEKYGFKSSFIGAYGGYNRRKRYQGIEIPFDSADFKLLQRNQVFNYIDGITKEIQEGRVTGLAWNIYTDTAVIDFYITFG